MFLSSVSEVARKTSIKIACFPKAADFWTVSAYYIFIEWNFACSSCTWQVESECIEQDNGKHLLDSLSLSSLFIKKASFMSLFVILVL